MKTTPAPVEPSQGEQLIKDYDLLRQMNVNFVRLSHYPHNRMEHEVLDELGNGGDLGKSPWCFCAKPR